MPRRPWEPTRNPQRRSNPVAGPLLTLTLAASLALTTVACESSPPQAAPGRAPTTAASDASADPITISPDDAGGPTSTDRPAIPPTAVTRGTAVSHSPTTTKPSALTDVRDVAFADMTYPGSACLGVIDRPPTSGYRLVDGVARSDDRTREDSYAVTLQDAMSYGDVNGDGVGDVAIVLECERASRPVPVGWVYTVESGRPEPLARVTLDPDSLPLSGVLDTSLDRLQIQGTTVHTDWAIYLDGDALCCPSKTATVSWSWSGDELIAGTPAVARSRPGG